jgi:hypothetical protein
VLSAGLATIMEFGPWTVAPVTFLRQMYAAGATGTDPADSEQNFGLLRADFTHKLAFDVVRGRSPLLNRRVERSVRLLFRHASRRIVPTSDGRRIRGAGTCINLNPLLDSDIGNEPPPYRHTGSGDHPQPLQLDRSLDRPAGSVQLVSHSSFDGGAAI